MAPQFTGTNGAEARGLRAWTARATSSLPTPLSPVIRTVVRATATFSTTSNTSCIAPLRATIDSKRPRAESCSRNSSLSCARMRPWRASSRFCSAALTSAISSAASVGDFST